MMIKAYADIFSD